MVQRWQYTLSLKLPLLNCILKHLLLGTLVLFILIKMRRLAEIAALSPSEVARLSISHRVYNRLETCLLVLISRFRLRSHWPILLTLLLLIVYDQNCFVFLSLGHRPLRRGNTWLLAFLTSCVNIQNLPVFIFFGIFFLLLFFLFLFFTFVLIVNINILVFLLILF